MVVGAGTVGLRKARGLLEASAQVRVVCLEPRPADEAFSSCDWRIEPYRAEHLDGAALVFAAAPPNVNRQVVADARRLGAWINVADCPQEGDFHVPATCRRGNLVVSVGTCGIAPGFGAWLCRELNQRLDENYAVFLDLLAQMRTRLRERIVDDAWRRTLAQGLAEPAWFNRLQNEGRDAVFAAMVQLVDEAEATEGREISKGQGRN